MNKKHAFYRGFTLIELMIVIVILGILMGTILPRLTGAQGRARDTARRADLNNISQALEVYQNDKGSYPGLDGSATNKNCLNPGNQVADALAQYLKGNAVPTPPSTRQMTLGGCEGSYYYAPLTKNGVARAAYVLVSDVETWQMANYNTAGSVAEAGSYTSGTAPTIGEFNTTNDTYNKLMTSGKFGELTSETQSAVQSVFIVIP